MKKRARLPEQAVSHVAVRSKQDSGQAKQDTLCGKAGQRIRGAS